LGVGAAAVTGVLTDVLPGRARLRWFLGMDGPDGEVPDAPAGPVTVERLRSQARGRDTDLVIMRPAGAPQRLPMCLALHGRGARATTYVDMGIPQFLTAAARSGVPPFAVVAVDGNETYFVARDGRDDPQRMLTEELPAWLDARGLPAPTTAFGISMGAFGVLRFARNQQDLRAVAVIGPALFRSWADAKARNVFRDEKQWAANEPLRHTSDLAGNHLGVWCGTDDPFIDSARELVDRTHPKIAAIGPGVHENGYFVRVMPEVFRFIGAAA
jgi:S-formylglutathione hydrolase FrmB